MRLVHTAYGPKSHAKVYRLSDTDEYRVRLYVPLAGHPVTHEACDYFTADKVDAIETAVAMVQS